MTDFRWGVIGPQGIANTFGKGLDVVPDGVLGAVASRSLDKAKEYAAKYGSDATTYDDYDALIADPSLDAIYIAIPHVFHKDLALKCLAAGKPVMCEKPLTTNAAESRELVELAKANNLFLMEAVWSRFLPLYIKIKQIIDAGTIGDVRLILSSFGFLRPYEPDLRWLNKDLAGGVLLDMGIYNITISQFLLGLNPISVKANGILGSTGVDMMTSATMLYESDAMSVFSSGFNVKMPNSMEIMGTKGSIHTEDKFWFPEKATLKVGDEVEELEAPFKGSGFEYEIMETQRCIRAGLTESPGMNWADTLANMAVMDDIRAQIGLKYDWE